MSIAPTRNGSEESTMTTAPLTTSGVTRRLSHHGVKKSEGTVRNLNKAGLLRAMAVTESGVKLYDPAEVDRLATALLERRAQ